MNKEKFYLNHSVVAIIPARGGSKRLPGKNIMPLLGKPMIYYSIKAAIEAVSVQRVFVSTEDEEIAGIADRCGAEIIMRPQELAEDNSTTESVLLNAISTLEKEKNYKPEIVLLLQPTSPIRKPGNIDEAVKLLIFSGADSLLSVTNSPAFYWKNDGKGYYKPVNYDYRSRPFHHTMKQYRENGSLYIIYRERLISGGCRLDGRISVFEMPEEYSIEVDTPSQYAIAEAIMRNIRERIV